MRKLLLIITALAMLVVPSAAMAAPVPTASLDMSNVGSCNDGPKGKITVSKGIATIKVPDSSAYGVIKMFPTNLKVKDIKTLQFKSNSSMGGMVYMNVVTDAGHKIKYTPAEQFPVVPELGIGAWATQSPMTAGVRLNDLNDGGPTMTWADAVSELGNETVNRVSITAGCSAGFGSVQVDKFQVNNTMVDFK